LTIAPLTAADFNMICVAVQRRDHLAVDVVADVDRLDVARAALGSKRLVSSDRKGLDGEVQIVEVRVRFGVRTHGALYGPCDWG
jgi:hypothetical protein